MRLDCYIPKGAKMGSYEPSSALPRSWYDGKNWKPCVKVIGGKTTIEPERKRKQAQSALCGVIPSYSWPDGRVRTDSFKGW